MHYQEVKIRCPKCRNTVIETAREGNARLVTRYKQVDRIGGHPAVQCRFCGVWIRVPKELIW